MTTDLLVRELRARRSGSYWMARCPAHDDTKPSLSIREENGKTLIHCHAGCSQTRVIGALNEMGLWKQQTRASSNIVATYNYTDERGSLLYQVIRYEPKNFKQRHPDGVGGWIWKKYEPQALYRLGEVMEAPIVFVVEGEKDVDALRAWGFVATTNAGGANAAWLPQYNEVLAGREVNIIPDNDQPGWERATRIARALLGHSSRVRILDLPREVKDISEWFDRGHSECELISKLEGTDAI